MNAATLSTLRDRLAQQRPAPTLSPWVRNAQTASLPTKEYAR